MRWLFNLFTVLFLLLVFLLAVTFVLGNTQPVTLELFWTNWQPSVPSGQLLVAVLAAGMLLGLLVGVMIASGWHLSRRRRIKAAQRAGEKAGQQP